MKFIETMLCALCVSASYTLCHLEESSWALARQGGGGGGHGRRHGTTLLSRMVKDLQKRKLSRLK